ncbi:YceI family protein [Paraburkholderia panacisoli]|uniref:YceI family protein n=1 Tax=Paraburkholderia panacisoli TaxID=2603818 RepID=A0A5B0G9F7_9BURK|nr:YceI family protein [Paraburkholderia panacisoli]KAA0999148.1 YceI family protein [Paraburkholderia panacisoli]
MKGFLVAFLITLVAVPGARETYAGQPQIDMKQSKITATSTQMGAPVEGQFRKIDARIDLNAANPVASSAKVSIETGSYDLGDPTYNEQVQGKDWFDSGKFPVATFVSQSIKAIAGDKYEVMGVLSIKGTSRTVTVPVSVTQNGSSTICDGKLTIRRKEYGIGSGEWTDTSVVANDVDIRFHLVSFVK